MCIFAVRLGNSTLFMSSASNPGFWCPPPPLPIPFPGRGGGWLAGGGDSPRPRARGGEVCPGRAHGVATSRAKRATFAARRPLPRGQNAAAENAPRIGTHHGWSGGARRARPRAENFLRGAGAVLAGLSSFRPCVRPEKGPGGLQNHQ